MLVQILSACAVPPAPPIPAEEAETARALSYLSVVDDTTLVQTFSRLDTLSHTRHSHIMQQIGAAAPAVITRIVHQDANSDAQEIARHEINTIARGFGSTSQADMRIGALVHHIVDSCPAHLNAKFADDYVYRILPDTTLWGHTIQMIDVTARTHAAQPTRYARYFFYQESIVGIYLEHVAHTLLFSEIAHYFLQLRPGPQGNWLPHHVHVSTHLRIPLGSVRRLSRTATMYSYGQSP